MSHSYPEHCTAHFTAVHSSLSSSFAKSGSVVASVDSVEIVTVVRVFVDVVVGGGVMVGIGSSQSPQSVQSVPTAQNSGSSQAPSLAYSHVSLRPANVVLVNVVVLVESPYAQLPSNWTVVPLHFAWQLFWYVLPSFPQTSFVIGLQSHASGHSPSF